MRTVERKIWLISRCARVARLLAAGLSQVVVVEEHEPGAVARLRELHKRQTSDRLAPTGAERYEFKQRVIEAFVLVAKGAGCKGVARYGNCVAFDVNEQKGSFFVWGSGVTKMNNLMGDTLLPDGLLGFVVEVQLEEGSRLDLFVGYDEDATAAELRQELEKKLLPVLKQA